MTERYGPCPNCRGHGKIETLKQNELVTREVIKSEDKDGHVEETVTASYKQVWYVRECLFCEGSGFDGSAMRR
jgi:hypothetical protein